MKCARRLFRGTTIDWHGNPGLSSLECTPTTTDPLIATLFALECRRHGPAVVYSVDLADVAHLVTPGNVLAGLEREIVVSVTPLQFIRDFATSVTPVETACKVLLELALETPGVISTRYNLQKALESLQKRNQALSTETIEAFINRLEMMK